MKKLSRVSMESSPAASYYYPVGVEARTRFKHQSLMQDYDELRKQIEAKRKKLWIANKKKLELLAVVKFLQRKFKCLFKNPSQRIPYRLKKQSLKLSSPSNVDIKVPLKDRNHKVIETPIPTTTALLDLNQIFIPNGEEVELEPPRTDWSKRCSVDGDEDVGDGAKQVDGKRQISWQDQVALRV